MDASEIAGGHGSMHSLLLNESQTYVGIKDSQYLADYGHTGLK